MLAQFVEADIHQLHRVDRVDAVPRIDATVRGSTLKSELGPDQRIVL